MKYILQLFLLFGLTLFSPNLQGKETLLNFKSLPSYINIPTDVQQIYQDNVGFIWFATRNGLYRFDGYKLETIKSNLYTPNALSSNDILVIREDYSERLWIGTTYGLNMLDKKTGRIQKDFGILNNERVQSILVTSDSTIWLGTGSALFKSRHSSLTKATPSFVKVKSMDVKSLLEAPNHQVWIGTWSDGVYRYDALKDNMIEYPPVNSLNSAYVLFQDENKQIWVGTWGYGLYKLHHPYEPERAFYEKFVHEEGNKNSLIHNLIYSISEDLNTGNLWIGTCEGLSCFDGKKFTNYTACNSPGGLPFNEIINIFREQSGTMWLGFLGGSVYWCQTQTSPFNLHELSSDNSQNSCTNIQGITVYNNKLWIGLEKHNFLVLNRATNSLNKRETNILQSEYTFYSFLPKQEELWLGSYGNGVYIYRPQEDRQTLYNLNSSKIPNFPNFIYCMFEDEKQNVFLGSTTGLSIYTKEQELYHFSNLDSPKGLYEHSVYSIVQDSLDNIWIGTAHNGVFKMTPAQDWSRSTFKPYSIDNGKLNSNEIQCLFVDKSGNLLVGTDGGGLNLYDPKQDSFISIHAQYNIPGDMICSILEDDQHNLWMGSNVGLIKLNLRDSISESKCHLYTTSDGLQDNKFARGAACVADDGEMFFGGPRGYNSFFPEQITANKQRPNCFITDIKINGESIKKLSMDSRVDITSGLLPEHVQTLCLNYTQNDISCELSVLNFLFPIKNEYAYKLDGIDPSWQYTANRSNVVSYSNLGCGTYTLYIKGTSGDGVWSKAKKALTIIITPPWWQTRWAYLGYFFTLLGFSFYIACFVKKKIALRNALRIKEIEQKKSEEVNRAKLQFFTNITHEFLTPLTIISVTLSEIKNVAPQMGNYYGIVDNNINRLKRLLQQILEFRKAESGNLKLKVSQGDIASFIAKNIESFLPLLKDKDMHLDILIEPKQIIGYFDSDKVDKILYNLLSNAFKYNRKGETIQIRVAYGTSEKEITISIRDHGDGIAPENLPKLFQRFYEGDYRKFHTTGHGIGLSLTKELVVLHHGRIEVESVVNKGTTFTVTLPIAKENFSEEEIDGNTTGLRLSCQADRPLINQDEKEGCSRKILLVEDNEDLSEIMSQALSREYNVVKATNGKEAIEQLESIQDIAIIISDVMMPVMDGIELCHTLKHSEKWLHIPIILLTAKRSENDIIEGYEAGADDYITKPFQLDILLAKIKSLLKNKENIVKIYANSIIFKMQKQNIDTSDKDFLDRAINCVYKYLDDINFDHQTFAEAMGMSKSTLYRKLKNLSGITPQIFISEIRLQTAYKILSDNPQIPISDLAYRVGYGNPKYFSSCFKRKYNVNPSDISKKEEYVSS